MNAKFCKVAKLVHSLPIVISMSILYKAKNLDVHVHVALNPKTQGRRNKGVQGRLNKGGQDCFNKGGQGHLNKGHQGRLNKGNQGHPVFFLN